MCNYALQKIPSSIPRNLLLLLLLLKEVGSATLRESDIHRLSPKRSASQYQPRDKNKRKGKIVEDNSGDNAA